MGGCQICMAFLENMNFRCFQCQVSHPDKQYFEENKPPTATCRHCVPTAAAAAFAQREIAAVASRKMGSEEET